MSHAQFALKTGQAKLWILLVGVSQYHDRRFPILQYSTVDTQQLADAFTDVIREFPDTSVKVHHDSALPPTVSNVRSSLQEIVEKAQPQDTVLFYFSGHGALDPRMQQVVFCLADTQKEAMIQTGLSAISLLGALGNCAAKQQILWIDACHANGLTPQTDAPEILDNPTAPLIEMLRQKAAQSAEFQALLSCDRAQQSWKFPELGHSIFSHFLIEGLRGGAANPQGIVTASVLGNYVHDRTIQYIDRTNQQLEWLHRDGEKRNSRAIVQKPARIGNAQLHLPIGIRPKDPLEYLFPEIKAPKIEPPLASSTPIRKPIVPPPIEKPTTIEPKIPLIQKIEKLPEHLPIAPPTPEIISIEPVLPKVQEPVESTLIDEPESIPPLEEPPIEFRLEEAQLEEIQSIERQQVEEAQPEPVQLIAEPQTAEPRIEEIQPEPVQLLKDQLLKDQLFEDQLLEDQLLEDQLFENPQIASLQSIEAIQVEDIQPELPNQPIAEIQPIAAPQIEFVPVQPIKPEKIQPPVIAQPLVEESIEPVRKHNETQRQIKRFRRITKKRLRHSAIALRQASQAAGNFAASQHTQAKQQANHLRNHLSTKISALNQSTRQAAASGQTLYRQRSTEVSHIASDAAQQIDRSTRQIAQSANNLLNTAAEQTQKPQTRQFATTAIKSLGIIAIGVTGMGLYMNRNEQIREMQALSNAATTQMQENQTVQALSTALKAGHRLQQVDQPWNFVPETLKLSTIATLQQAIALNEDASPVVGVGLANATLSSDQKTFAVSTSKNTIQIWQRNRNQLQQREVELSGHKAAITKLSFSPNGKLLASASADKTIKLWDIEKGILIQTLAAHTEAVTALSFRSDGEVLASGSADQTIKLWAVSNGRILDTFKGHDATASVIRFSPDGRILAAGTLSNSIHLWYPDSQNPVLLGSHSRTATEQGINDLEFTLDGKTIASAGADKTIRLWNVGSANSEREAIPTQTLTGHENEVTSLSFSASGQILASGGSDRTIRLWNMQNGTFLKTLIGAQDPINQLTFSTDGKSLLSVGDRYGLKRWNLDLDSLIETGCQRVRSSECS